MAPAEYLNPDNSNISVSFVSFGLGKWIKQGCKARSSAWSISIQEYEAGTTSYVM